MRIPIDRQRPVALYRQIEAHLRRTIASGALPPGARLPATRALARDLGVNRLTVETAYAELEADGLLAARPGDAALRAGRRPLPRRLAPRRTAWPAWQLELAGGPAPPRRRPRARPRPRHLVRGRSGRPGAVPGGGAAPRAPGGDAPGRRPRRSTTAPRRGSRACAGPSPRCSPARGSRPGPEDVLVTAGSQQALALAADAAGPPRRRRPGGAPDVPGSAGALPRPRRQVVAVPTDADGMRTGEL